MIMIPAIYTYTQTFILVGIHYISYLLHFSARCIYTYNKSKCWIYIHKKRECCSIGNKATDRKTLVKEQVTLKLPGEQDRGYWS